MQDAAGFSSQQQMLQMMTAPSIHQGQEVLLFYKDGAALGLLFAQEKHNYAQSLFPWFTPFQWW